MRLLKSLEKKLLKTAEKRENADKWHFLFPTPVLSTIWKTNLMFWVTLNLSSANAFNLDENEILSSGQEFFLALYQMIKFWISPIRKHAKMTK